MVGSYLSSCIASLQLLNEMNLILLFPFLLFPPPIQFRFKALFTEFISIQNVVVFGAEIEAAEGKKQGIFFSARQFFFQRSSRNRVDLLSYESKPTDKREQYDLMAEKNLDG